MRATLARQMKNSISWRDSMKDATLFKDALYVGNPVDPSDPSIFKRKTAWKMSLAT